MSAALPLPMKAAAGPLPIGDDWMHEVKWDGMRAVVGVDGSDVLVTSVRGRDVTVSFPELAGLGRALGVTSAVLDGEIVAFDDAGRPDFGLLQSRMHVTNPRVAAERAAAVPCVYLVFDLLALDGTSLVELAWADRRRLLEGLVVPGPHWNLPATHVDGAALLDAARTGDLEGIVSKRTTSRYRPGTRTHDWVKVKIRRRQEFVVGGWASGSGAREGRIGGLLVGYHDEPGDGRLRYAGRVGSGLSDADLTTIGRRLDELATDECPFTPPPPNDHRRGARWVRPIEVVEVEYAEWTQDRRLRHPTFAGRRTDVDPDDVTDAP